MAATAQPNIGNKAGYAPGDNGWVEDYNYLNRAVDSLVQCTIAAIQATPPGTRTNGKLYIAATGATGAWAGWDGRIVRDNVTSWESYVPKDGWYVYNQSDATAYRRKSGAWQIDDFLAKNNPTFTGRLSGNDVKIGSASSAGWLQLSTNNTGTGTFNIDFLGGTSSNRRMTFRWSDANDTLIVMTSNDDGSARADRVTIPRSSALPIAVAGGFNVSTGDLSVGGVAVVDSSRNGSFAGLAASGTISGPRATLSEFGVLREYVGLSTIGALYPTGVTPTGSNYAMAIHDDGSKAYVGAATETGFAIAGNLKLTATASAVNLGSAVELQQNGTTRITAGGDGRFTSLRASGLAASSTYLTRLDSNGELIAAAIKEDLGDLGGSTGLRTAFDRPLRLAAAGGAWGGSSYASWTPSAYLPISDDSQGNSIENLRSGWIWNSQRMNALTITDGAAATPYRGRVRADRWVATSLVSVSGTTSATSWFAGGSGDGSPTLPANYLKGGRRVRAKGRVSCQSCAADTAPEFAFKVGSTTIKTQAKAFTIAAGNAIYVDVDVDFWADGDGFLVAVGDIKFYSASIGAAYEFKINYAGAYDGSTAKTIDATIKPSSAAETWARNLAFIEA